MLKVLAVVCLFVGVVVCDINVDAKTTYFENDIDYTGKYNWRYATSNGIEGQEAGVGGQFADGQSKYISPEGIPIQLSYRADENGYQPSGSHLPTPPPIPEYILRSLEYIRTHPSKDSQ